MAAYLTFNAFLVSGTAVTIVCIWLILEYYGTGKDDD